MSVFDLVLIAAVLVAAGAPIAAAAAALTGHRRPAARILAAWGAGLAGYLGLVVAVSLASPQREVPLGRDRCFDDWCVAVMGVTRAPELGRGADRVRASGQFYVIELRLSNHARGRAQRASSAAVRLVVAGRQRYDVSPPGQAAWQAEHGPVAPLTATLAVGQSVTTVQVFDLPAGARDVGLTVVHPVGPSPGLFVISDEASLFHKPTIVRLP